jgi:hypothetical protein
VAKLWKSAMAGKCGFKWHSKLFSFFAKSSVHVLNKEARADHKVIDWHSGS